MKRQIDLLFVSYNGARTLPAMLEGLAGQLPTRRPLRILAVNNGSTDATGQILAAWSGRLPMRVLQGPGSGKVPALAQAASELEGDLVVLTDDDILPEPGWLAQLEAAADRHPEAGIFGGAIEPIPIEATGDWYAAACDYEVDLFSKADAPAGPVIGADTIFGPNMMLRLDAAKAGLSASTALGPSPAVKNGKRVFPLGDESEMLSRLEAAGAQAIFVPEARVKHMVRGFQTDLGFMLQRAQNHGRGVALRALGEERDMARRSAIVASSLARALWLAPRCVMADRSVPDRRVFNALYGLNWHIGRIKGALKGPFPPLPGDACAG
ncbi:glycosyltransferase family A protein [Hyphomonas sp.]|uniref:glycosyltransferase family A protein n=1 Tax=Hyphomonas sp. TaxID=87 RepID=UPI00391A3175